MTLTTLQAAVTKTAAFDGAGVAINALTKPCSVRVRVTALTADKVATFALQTSADDFSADIKTEWVKSVKGPIASRYPFEFPWPHEYDMPGVRVGTASAKMRLVLLYIDGSSSVTYEAQIVSN